LFSIKSNENGITERGERDMSRYAHFACLECRVTLFLGKVVSRSDDTINFFRRTNLDTPNSQRSELNRALWKMLADHAGHPLRVLLEWTPEYDAFMDDEAVVWIGGDEPGHDIPFEEYLKDWNG
jgi:hypothetical protein